MFKRKNLIRYIIVVLFIGLCCNFMHIYFTGGAILHNVLYGNYANDFQFWDFTRPIVWNYQYSNPYEEIGNCYPPFIATIFKALSHVLYVANTDSYIDLTNGSYGAMIIVLYLMFCLWCIAFSIRRFLNDVINTSQADFIIFLVFFSIPFWAYSMKTGNAVLLSAAFCSMAISLKDDEKWYLKEMALILIAAAAGIKVFPAILGIIFLKQHRYKESLRLIIYGAITCLGMFIIFGGVDGISLFLRNLSHQNSIMCSVGTFPEVVYTYILHPLNLVDYWDAVSSLIMIIWIVICVFLFWLNNESWASYLLLISTFIVSSRTEQAYNLVYITIPFMMWIKESNNKDSEKINFEDIIVPIMFAGIFFNFEKRIQFGFLYILILLALHVNVKKIFNKEKVEGDL